MGWGGGVSRGVGVPEKYLKMEGGGHNKMTLEEY